MVLFEIVVLFPLKAAANICETVPVPKLLLLNVLPVILFVGAPPSLSKYPVKVIAPVNVMFENVLFWKLHTAPAGVELLEVLIVIVPPAPVLFYAVTIELLLILETLVAENDPGYGTKNEAIRVIAKGPNWKPAVQNGRNVIYRHKQSITFLVADE